MYKISFVAIMACVIIVLMIGVSLKATSTRTKTHAISNGNQRTRIQNMFKNPKDYSQELLRSTAHEHLPMVLQDPNGIQVLTDLLNPKDPELADQVISYVRLHPHETASWFDLPATPAGADTDLGAQRLALKLMIKHPEATHAFYPYIRNNVERMRQAVTRYTLLAQQEADASKQALYKQHVQTLTKLIDLASTYAAETK